MQKPECVYIAGPMNGCPEYNTPAFLAAEERLKKEGHYVVNPAYLGEIPGLNGWRDYWPINRAMLKACTAIYMLAGWEKSPGAKNEHRWAGSHGLVMMYE